VSDPALGQSVAGIQMQVYSWRHSN